jgi:hypothetical protein
MKAALADPGSTVSKPAKPALHGAKGWANASVDSPLWQRYHVLVNGGPGRPALLEHPLHAEFLSLAYEAKALLLSLTELSLEDDGTAASAARAIHMKVIGKIMKRKCDRLAAIQLRKAKHS